MDVDIVDRVGDEAQRSEPRLFACFPQRGAAHVGIAVDVTAQLQPLVELAVMREQRARAGRIDDPGRRGDVPDRQRTVERTGVLGDEGDEAVTHRGLARVERSVRP